jgi:hypothetical protein
MPNRKVLELKMRLFINQSQRVGLRTRNSNQLMTWNSKKAKKIALSDQTLTIHHLCNLSKTVMLSKSEESTRPWKEWWKQDKPNWKRNLWQKEVCQPNLWHKSESLNKLWVSPQIRTSLALPLEKMALNLTLRSQHYSLVSLTHKD